MTQKERPGGDADRAHELPRQGLNEFEDRAKEAGRKRDRADLELIIGEILAALGDPERDGEQQRTYRHFRVRLLHEPLQAVGIAPPPSTGSEFRVLVMFRDEPAAVPYFIGSDFVAAFQLANRLRRLNECRFQFGPAWEAEGGA
jgi:hypothetical protein